MMGQRHTKVSSRTFTMRPAPGDVDGPKSQEPPAGHSK